MIADGQVALPSAFARDALGHVTKFPHLTWIQIYVDGDLAKERAAVVVLADGDSFIVSGLAGFVGSSALLAPAGFGLTSSRNIVLHLSSAHDDSSRDVVGANPPKPTRAGGGHGRGDGAILAEHNSSAACKRAATDTRVRVYFQLKRSRRYTYTCNK